MMDALIELDKALFELINGSWHVGFADSIAPWWREKTTWIPLYLALVIWLIIRFRVKALFILAGAGLVILCADQLSSSVIKPLVGRLRPCNDPLMEVRLLLDHCGAGKSFTSSHATNHFAIYVFLAAMLRGHLRYVVPLGFIWAASISYAQVYVGVHYPADILAGALLGSFLGWLIAKIIRVVPAAGQIFPRRNFQ